MPQLDEHRIAIRERKYVDLLDLSLKVVASYAGPLALAITAGAGPMFLLNHCLLAGYVDQHTVLGEPVHHLSMIAGMPIGLAASAGLVWYMLIVLLLIFLEMSLATAATTLYLGQAVFSGQPDARRIWREFRQSLPQLLVFQTLLRPLLLVFPYLDEVILLERHPIRAERRGELTVMVRCFELHRGDMANVMVFRLVGLGTGVVVFAGIWLAILAARAILLGTLAIDLPMQTVYFQLSVWGAVGFFCVVRFLNYLNLRIRREGWEVELKLRAEAARLAKGLK